MKRSDWIIISVFVIGLIVWLANSCQPTTPGASQRGVWSTPAVNATAIYTPVPSRTVVTTPTKVPVMVKVHVKWWWVTQMWLDDTKTPKREPRYAKLGNMKPTRIVRTECTAPYAEIAGSVSDFGRDQTFMILKESQLPTEIVLETWRGECASMSWSGSSYKSGEMQVLPVLPGKTLIEGFIVVRVDNKKITFSIPGSETEQFGSCPTVFKINQTDHCVLKFNNIVFYFHPEEVEWQ
jgi:hypothetical protein